MSAKVVALPSAYESEDRAPGVVEFFRRRVDGTYELDRWGFDPDLTRVAARLARLRWTASIDGVDRIPAEGPVLLVANRRLGWSEPVVLASALLGATGRIVRPVGGLDVEPVGGLLRRFGALPARPDEVAASLRDDQVVLVPTRREPVRSRPGHLPIELIAPAVRMGIAIVPVAVTGWELGRHWSVQVGGAVRPGPKGDAVAVGQAAVEVSTALDELMDAAHPRGPIERVVARVPVLGRIVEPSGGGA